jgi:hypothetical protein
LKPKAGYFAVFAENSQTNLDAAMTLENYDIDDADTG